MVLSRKLRISGEGSVLGRLSLVQVCVGYLPITCLSFAMKGPGPPRM